MPPQYYHVAPQQPTQPHPPVPQQQQPHMLAAHSYPAPSAAWPNAPSLPTLAAGPNALPPASAPQGHPYIDAASAHPHQLHHPHHHPQQQHAPASAPPPPVSVQPPSSAPPPQYIAHAGSSPFSSFTNDPRLAARVAPVYPLPAPNEQSVQDVEDMLQMDAASPLPTPLPDDLPAQFSAASLQQQVTNNSAPKNSNNDNTDTNPEPKDLNNMSAKSSSSNVTTTSNDSKTEPAEKDDPSLRPSNSSKSIPDDNPAVYAAPDLLTTTVSATMRRSSLALGPHYSLTTGPLSPSKSVSGNKPPSKPGKSGKSTRKLPDVPSVSPARETIPQTDSNSSLGAKPMSKSQASLSHTPPALAASSFVSPPRLASPDSAAEPPSELDLNVAPSDDQSALISSTEPLSFGASAASVFDYTQLEVDFENRIGVGTYGAVYIGRFYGELVAVKRILVPKQAATAAHDPFVAERHKEAIRQFAREIRRYESISHPGIVRYLGITLPPDSSALLVTQLMHGGSLSGAISEQRRAKCPFDQSAIVRIAMQACGGLRALHQAKCTWGDAKPENILLSENVDSLGMFPLNAEARIADFGLSRSVGQTLLADTTLAGSGQPAGTYNYMAPESYSGVDRNNPEEAKSSDIFSFGMVIYEMLTLRTPFRRRQLMDVFHAVRDGERPAWPVESDPDYYGPMPAELKNLVERCWQQKPNARPSADDVFHTLEEFANDHDDAAGHRQMLGIASDPDTSDVAACQASHTSGGIQTMGSRQSSVSTAIAIGDGSVDFGGLTSTHESQRLPDGSDDEDDDGDSMIAPVVPQMSPITSPEPRVDCKGDDTSGADSTPPKKPQQTGLGKPKIEPQLPQVESTKKPTSNKTMFPQHSGMQFVNSDAAQKAILSTPSEGASAYEAGRFDASQPSMLAEDGSAVGSAVVQENSQPDLALLKTTEFIKHRDEIAFATATAASKIVRAESTEKPDESEPNLSGSISNTVLIPNSPNGLESTMDLSSSNNSTATASLRRKRRSRLQSIIEHAAHALIEIQRRDESLNKTPPKQRKEAAEKKAQENARMRSERDALKTIDDAKKQGDFSMVLDEMRLHRHSQAVIKVSTSVLEQYCKDESYYLDICEEGGVEELVSAAALHGIQDEHLSVLFCDCIKALSEHYDHKVSHLVRAVGAPSSVIELLQHHKTAVKVQIAGCECLAVIASGSELSRSAVATLGGPAAVYQAMTKNNTSFKDVELARAALRAIRDIAQDNERAAEYLVQVAALDTVVRAADTFTTHGLERDILDALRAFSFYDGGRRNVIMSSGLKALTAIMVRNQEPDFSVQCCTFIREIARWRDLECEQNMLQSSISERITALMKTSNDIPGEEGARVAWYASHACTFLASFGSQSRQRLRQVGAIEMAIKILSNRVENARVVHSATDALAELIRNEAESKAEAEGLNVVAVLNDALNTHREIARVKNALQWTLDYMTSPNAHSGGGNGMLGGGRGGAGANGGVGGGARATPGAGPGATDSRVVQELEQNLFAANPNKGVMMPAPEPQRRRKLLDRFGFTRRNR